MNEAAAYLPGVLGQIAEEVGEAAALKLAAARGGTHFEIPKEAAGSMLASIVGEEDAASIIRILGHGRVKLPAGSARGAGRRRAQAARLLHQGHSLREVAIATGYDQRTVEKMRASMNRRDDRAPELPFDKA